MPQYFFRPENALKRANEFIEVDKYDSALDVLSDIIRSKKHRQWSEVHERIIKLYLHLCVKLQKSPNAKDGLYQYRNICKDTNLHSFQTVIDEFLTNVENKAAAARKESEQTVLDIEDLDQMQTPESLLLSTVSGEGAQDRSDRIVLTPWVKFLWESFRNILELLKNNTLMESIYATVAKRAFGFCLEYKRRTEFHKLCDILRTHLRNAQEHQQAQNCLKFDNPDTIQCLVEVRFEQLEKAISIDLWQEAFRGIEDIHSLISGPKHKAKASLLENFYSKQSSVYWMANNKLFHAAALYRLFALRKEQKKSFVLDSEEAKKTASQVLLATLSVPIHPIPSGIDRFLVVDTNTQGKVRRLADLLRMQTPPTRASLLKELSRIGIIQCVSPQLQQLYTLLEVEFNPLVLCEKVEPLLNQLEENEDTKQYVESLKEVTLVRLIKQVSQLYQSIQLTRLCELGRFTDPVQMERLVVETAKTNNIPVRIDHTTDSFWFGADLTLSQNRKDPEGSVVQPLPSELFCDHLSVMARALQQATKLVFQREMESKLNKKYNKIVVKCRENEVASHKAIMRRSRTIEERKEYLEGVQKEKENKEKLKLKVEEREKIKKKQEKLDEEMKEEMDKKKKKETAELEKKIAEDKLEALKKTAIGAKAFADITAEELKDLDTNTILKKQLLQMEKEKRDKETKLKGQEKKIDYFERAKHLVEIPKRKKEYKEQLEADRKFHEEREEERIQLAVKEREQAMVVKNRLIAMEDSKSHFMNMIQEKRSAQYKEKLAEFEKRLDEEREKRLEQRKIERKRKREAEAAARRKTEKERKTMAKLEAQRLQKEAEKKAHLEKMEQMRLKQLEREQEIEEKRRKKDEERMKVLQETTSNNKEESEPTSWRQQDDRSWRQQEDDRSSWRRNDPPRGGDRPPWHGDRDRQDGGGRSWGDRDRTDRPWGDRDRTDKPWGERDRGRDRQDGGGAPWGERDRGRDRQDGGGAPWGDRDRGRDRQDAPWGERDRGRDRPDGGGSPWGGRQRPREDRNPEYRGGSDRYRGDRSEPDRYRPPQDSDRYRGDGDRYQGDSGRYRGDGDRYRGDGDRSRDGDRYQGDSGRYRGDRDYNDRFRNERESDRYRGPDRYRNDRGGGEWRRSPDRRGFDRSPRRDEGGPRGGGGSWRTEEPPSRGRLEVSPARQRGSDRSPRRKVFEGDQNQQSRPPLRPGEEEGEGWERVTRRR